MLRRFTILCFLLILCLSLSATYHNPYHSLTYRSSMYRSAVYQTSESRLATYRPYKMRSTGANYYVASSSYRNSPRTANRRTVFGFGGMGDPGDLGDPDSWNDPFSGGGTPIGDLDDPDSWNDPYAGGGGSILDDLSDPDGWSDPFSEDITPIEDLNDPSEWTDPYYGAPIGDVPIIWMACLVILYSVQRAMRHAKRQQNK